MKFGTVVFSSYRKRMRTINASNMNITEEAIDSVNNENMDFYDDITDHYYGGDVNKP